MRVPLPWLAEYCDTGLDAQALEERLTMTGTKVEAVSTPRRAVGRSTSSSAGY